MSFDEIYFCSENILRKYFFIFLRSSVTIDFTIHTEHHEKIFLFLFLFFDVKIRVFSTPPSTQFRSPNRPIILWLKH
jgi:hypothetical protein